MIDIDLLANIVDKAITQEFDLTTVATTADDFHGHDDENFAVRHQLQTAAIVAIAEQLQLIRQALYDFLGQVSR